MTACLHCLVRTPAHLLTRGHCSACLSDEAPELPAEEKAAIEARAVAACRDAGLNVVARPCVQPELEARGFRCGCKPRATVAPARPRRVDRLRGEPGVFGPFDAQDLERYFNASLPGLSGDKSVAGSMLERMAEATNRGSDEQPTPLREYRGPHGDCLEPGCHRHGAAWTEILDVGGGSQSVRHGAWDESMAAFIDSRSRMRRVWRTLSRLPRWAQRVLESRYTMSNERAGAIGEERSKEEAMAERHAKTSLGILAGVALMTETLAHRRERLAADGVSLRPRDALIDLAERSISSTATAADRAGARTALEFIRKDAEALTKKAEALYAQKLVQMVQEAA